MQAAGQGEVCARAQGKVCTQGLTRAEGARRGAEEHARATQTQMQDLFSQAHEAEATQAEDLDVCALLANLQEATLKVNEAKRQVRGPAFD